MSSIQTKIWFYYSNGKDHGPFDPEGITERARSGEITPSTLVRRQGRDYCEAQNLSFLSTAFGDADSAKPRRDQFGAVVRKEKPLSINVPPPFPVPPPLPESNTSSKVAVSPVPPSKTLPVRKPEEPESGIRWIFALPAGVLAAVIVAFPIHWFTMVNFGGWAYEPFIEIRDRDTLLSIELFLQALCGPLVFVYCAARTVPRYNRLVAVLLTVVIVLGLPLFANWWNSEVIASGEGILIETNVLRTLANAVGSMAAGWLIHLTCNVADERRSYIGPTMNKP